MSKDSERLLNDLHEVEQAAHAAVTNTNNTDAIERAAVAAQNVKAHVALSAEALSVDVSAFCEWAETAALAAEGAGDRAAVRAGWPAATAALYALRTAACAADHGEQQGEQQAPSTPPAASTRERAILRVMATDPGRRWSITGEDGIVPMMARRPKDRVGERTIPGLLKAMAEPGRGLVRQDGKRWIITEAGIKASKPPQQDSDGSVPPARRKARPISAD